MDPSFVLPGGSAVRSPVLLRIAGVPAEVLETLRFDRTQALVDTLIAGRDRLTAESSQLCDLLYELVGVLPGGAAKGRVVGLRRRVHRLRQPDGGLADLPADLADRVSAWAQALRDWQRERENLTATLAAEATEQNAVLRRALHHPGFRRALAQASPTLSAELDKWLADEDSTPRRHSLVQLAKYLARAAAKTSPYSTFTITGVGLWTAGDTETAAWVGEVGSVREIDGFLVQRLIRTLCADPRLAGLLALRVNPSATVVGDEVKYLGAPPREPIMTVPATDAVRACLRIVDEHAGLTAAALAPLLGGGDRAERFVRRLVDGGLLEHRLPVADQAPEPIAALAAWLADNASPEFADLAERLTELGKLLRDTTPITDLTGDHARRTELDRAIGAVAEQVGLTEGPGTERADHVYENAVFVGAPSTWPRRQWRSALADLDVLRRCLGALDPALPLRIAVSAFCAERFGAGARVPFLVLHEEIARELSRDGGTRTPAEHDLAKFLRPAHAPVEPVRGSRLPRLAELAEVQRTLRETILARDGGGEVVVDRDRLADLASRWPDWITEPPSFGCYLQAYRQDGELRVVVNAAHGGYGRGRSRAVRLIGQAGGVVTWDRLPTPAPGEPVLAEFGGMFGFAPNLRSAIAPCELDYPYTTSDRPSGELVGLRDLVVQHDGDDVRLVRVADGARVRALHLGMMADALLPPAARLLAQVFGSSYYASPSLLLLDPGEQRPALAPTPRVRMGAVVLQRARWTVSAADIPVRCPGGSDDEYLLQMVSWLRANGIPERCFVRAWSAGLHAPGELPTANWIMDKSHKPVYVDFGNWYLVQVFERMMHKCGPVVTFEEALPAPDEAVTVPGAPPAATEFLVEIGGGRDA